MELGVRKKEATVKKTCRTCNESMRNGIKLKEGLKTWKQTIRTRWKSIDSKLPLQISETEGQRR